MCAATRCRIFLRIAQLPHPRRQSTRQGRGYPAILLRKTAVFRMAYGESDDEDLEFRRRSRLGTVPFRAKLRASLRLATAPGVARICKLNQIFMTSLWTRCEARVSGSICAPRAVCDLRALQGCGTVLF